MNTLVPVAQGVEVQAAMDSRHVYGGTPLLPRPVVSRQMRERTTHGGELTNTGCIAIISPI